MEITINLGDLGRRLLSAVGLTTQDRADQEATRALEAGYYDGLQSGEDEPPSGTILTYGYRRHTAQGLRDFTKLNHDQLIEIVWTLYQSNPIAKRYLQIKRDYILGRGIQYQADDPDLTAILKAFWQANKLTPRLKQFVLQQRLWGEQCYPVFVRKTDGRVRLGYIDPSEIDDVIPHPHNSLEPWCIVLKFRANDRRRRIYRVIREDAGFVRGNRVTQPRHEGKLVTHEQAVLEPWEELFLRNNKLDTYTGSCFYFSINNVSNQPRGFSDLLQSADFMDAHDETLFALGEREAMAGYFSWDVTLTGSDETQIRKRANEIRKNPPQKKGAANVHNDSETWQFVHPDLKQPGSIATAEALETHILGGLGLPRHWYAHGDGTNRATAAEQNTPTFKTMEHDQDTARDTIVEILTFVRDQAAIAKAWKPGAKLENDQVADGTITVTMPEVARKDTAATLQLIPAFTQSLTVLMLDLNLVTRETAAQAVGKVLAEIGIAYDPTTELEAIDQETATDALDTGEAANAWLATRLNGRTHADT